MSRCGGRRGTAGQVGAGSSLPEGIIPSPLTRTVAAVRAELAGTPAGTICYLQGKASAGFPVGAWVSDGTSSQCEWAIWDNADGTEFVINDTGAADIEIDTGATLTWTSGLKISGSVATKVIPHCLKIRDAGFSGGVMARYSQSNPGAALVDGVFYGIGSYLPRGGTPLLALTANHYMVVGSWSNRIGLNLWPGPTFFGAVAITNDATGDLSTYRCPRGDGTNIQSSVMSGQIGDTSGPLPGAVPTSPALTEGWSQFSQEVEFGMFFDPKTSGQEVTFHDFRIIQGGT